MSTSMRRIAFLLGVMGLLVLLAGVWTPAPVVAQAPKAEFKLKLMGINRTLDPWKLFQEWAQAVEKRTNGRVQFELTSLPELSLGGAETIRVVKTGVVDVAEVYGGYVAGELPMVEIVELPGIFPDGQTARKAIMAWKPHETKLLDQIFQYPNGAGSDGIVRHAPNHDNHFHIRYRCAKADTACY